jgi:hypothetical protein
VLEDALSRDPRLVHDKHVHPVRVAAGDTCGGVQPASSVGLLRCFVRIEETGAVCAMSGAPATIVAPSSFEMCMVVDLREEWIASGARFCGATLNGDRMGS